MGATSTSRDAEHEIATIRCLVAQQIHALDRPERNGADRRGADAFLRQLLRRDEELRRRLAEKAVDAATR